MGLQQDYTLAAGTTGPIGAIAGVPPGQTAQIIVQAVNGSLQGVASEPVLFAMPAARVAEPKQPVTAEKPAAKKEFANGNGHRNGNGHLEVARMG